jgi:hypothetical protein
VLSGVPQGSVPGPLSLNLFIDDVCNIVKHSRYILFADNIKIYCTVRPVTDCTLLQADSDSICGWCAANCMKLKYDKSKVITFTRKTNAINLLKPSGNFIYHQVLHKKTLRGAHIAFMCFVRISEQTATFAL